MSGLIQSLLILHTLVFMGSWQMCNNPSEIADLLNGGCFNGAPSLVQSVNGDIVCSANSIIMGLQCVDCGGNALADRGKNVCVPIGSSAGCVADGGMLVTNDIDGTPLSSVSCLKCNNTDLFLTPRSSTSNQCDPCVLKSNQQLVCSCQSSEILYGYSCLDSSLESKFKQAVVEFYGRGVDSWEFVCKGFGGCWLHQGATEREEAQSFSQDGQLSPYRASKSLPRDRPPIA